MNWFFKKKEVIKNNKDYDKELGLLLAEIYSYRTTLKQGSIESLGMKITSHSISIKDITVVTRKWSEYTGHTRTTWDPIVTEPLKEGIISNLTLVATQLKFEVEEYQAKRRNMLQETINEGLSVNLENLFLKTQ